MKKHFACVLFCSRLADFFHRLTGLLYKVLATCDLVLTSYTCVQCLMFSVNILPLVRSISDINCHDDNVNVKFLGIWFYLPYSRHNFVFVMRWLRITSNLCMTWHLFQTGYPQVTVNYHPSHIGFLYNCVKNAFWENL